MSHNLMHDFARWAFTGLGGGIVLAILVAAGMGLPPELTLALVIIVGGVAMCLGPLALIVYRAGQNGGARRLEYGTLWGATWGLVLGSLYWFLYDNSFPLWHVVLPIAILAACGLINAALNFDTETRLSVSHSPSHRHSKPAAK